jgi:hypothetical protein
VEVAICFRTARKKTRRGGDGWAGSEGKREWPKGSEWASFFFSFSDFASSFLAELFGDNKEKEWSSRRVSKTGFGQFNIQKL